jgi:hypothetical protein
MAPEKGVPPFRAGLVNLGFPPGDGNAFVLRPAVNVSGQGRGGNQAKLAVRGRRYYLTADLAPSGALP